MSVLSLSYTLYIRLTGVIFYSNIIGWSWAPVAVNISPLPLDPQLGYRSTDYLLMLVGDIKAIPR